MSSERSDHAWEDAFRNPSTASPAGVSAVLSASVVGLKVSSRACCVALSTSPIASPIGVSGPNVSPEEGPKAVHFVSIRRPSRGERLIRGHQRSSGGHQEAIKR